MGLRRFFITLMTWNQEELLCKIHNHSNTCLWIFTFVFGLNEVFYLSWKKSFCMTKIVKNIYVSIDWMRKHFIWKQTVQGHLVFNDFRVWYFCIYQAKLVSFLYWSWVIKLRKICFNLILTLIIKLNESKFGLLNFHKKC